jgi:hypothetical protein
MKDSLRLLQFHLCMLLCSDNHLPVLGAVRFMRYRTLNLNSAHAAISRVQDRETGPGQDRAIR